MKLFQFLYVLEKNLTSLVSLFFSLSSLVSLCEEVYPLFNKLVYSKRSHLELLDLAWFYHIRYLETMPIKNYREEENWAFPQKQILNLNPILSYAPSIRFSS